MVKCSISYNVALDGFSLPKGNLILATKTQRVRHKFKASTTCSSHLSEKSCQRPATLRSRFYPRIAFNSLLENAFQRDRINN
jgi:hypothetical protein